MNFPHLALDSFRTFSSSLKKSIKGIKKYNGNAEKICRQIVNSCWNGRYLQTSCGHFDELWIRDLGWCSKALVNQGFKNKLRKSINYALEMFEKQNTIGTTISKEEKILDCPSYSIDTLPWIMRILKNLDEKKLVKKYKAFLEEQALQLFIKGFDTRIGLVNKGYYSSMKDFEIRNSSTYDNVMLAMLSTDLNYFKLNNPFKPYDIKKNIKKNLWNKHYFKNDLSSTLITSDSNIIPFITGVFTDETMLKKAIDTIIKEKLDEPMPIKYSQKDIEKSIIYYKLVKNYQGNTIWTHMGPHFIKLVQKIYPEKAVEYKAIYTRVIEHYKNYLEIFNPNLTIYKTLIYHSDESMLWAVNYLEI